MKTEEIETKAKIPNKTKTKKNTTEMAYHLHAEAEMLKYQYIRVDAI